MAPALVTRFWFCFHKCIFRPNIWSLMGTLSVTGLRCSRQTVFWIQKNLTVGPTSSYSSSPAPYPSSSSLLTDTFSRLTNMTSHFCHHKAPNNESPTLAVKVPPMLKWALLSLSTPFKLQRRTKRGKKKQKNNNNVDCGGILCHHFYLLDDWTPRFLNVCEWADKLYLETEFSDQEQLEALQRLKVQ